MGIIILTINNLEVNIMAKFQCSICGMIHEGLEAPEKCPVCKAPSSKFTIIDKSAPKATKLQKINDEDYEIIKKLETVGYIKTVDWFEENYSCKPEEAKEAIKSIKEKYNVNVNYQEDGRDEILEKLHSGESPLQVVKWYKERYDLGLKEARDKVDSVLKEYNINNGSNKPSGNGCAITILIAITSTLSVFCLL